MTCGRCGTAAHTLIGGSCVDCWTDLQPARTPLVRRVLRIVKPVPSDRRQVA